MKPLTENRFIIIIFLYETRVCSRTIPLKIKGRLLCALAFILSKLKEFKRILNLYYFTTYLLNSIT